ncbi:MAG: hypothetical protein J6V14_07460 [Clostridia bacterium]|nr:hypothetical protein [Clostridia bacterium]
MKEKGSGFGGFVLCFLTSLLYHAGWALAAVAMLIAALMGKTEMFYVYILLGVWGLSALISALIITFGNHNFAGPFVKQNNVNPYSKTNEDFKVNKT